MNSNILGAFFSLIAYSLFSGMDVINKFLLQLGSITFVNYLVFLDSSILIALLIIGITIYKKAFLKTNKPQFVAARAIFNSINTLSSLYAVSHLPLYVFYSLTFLTPFIAVLLALIFLKEKISWYKGSFLVLGFVGVIFVVYPSSNLQASTPISLLGALAAIMIALTNAASGIVVRKYMPSENTFTIAFYNILLSLAAGLTYVLLVPSQHLVLPIVPQLSLLFAAGILAGLGMVCSMSSFQKGRVINITHFHYTLMIFGIFFGYVIFRELPSIYGLIGVVIILISNVMITRKITKA